MEEIKDWVFASVIGLLSFIGKWWFNKIDTKVESIEKRLSQNEKAIELNTQSDRDYRDMTSKSLDEIKHTQNEIYKLLINRNI